MVPVYVCCRNSLYYTKTVSDQRNRSIWSLYIYVAETYSIILTLSIYPTKWIYMVFVYLCCRNSLYFRTTVSDQRNGSVLSLYIFVLKTLCFILKLYLINEMDLYVHYISLLPKLSVLS